WYVFFVLIFLCLLTSPLFAENTVEFAKDWSFSWVFKAESIEFTMSAPTTGWISLGFNPTRRMKDADYILAYVENGKIYISDEYGTGNTTHQSDISLGGKESVQAIAFVEEANKTTIIFSLPLNSGDKYDTVFKQGEKCKVLGAYSNSKNFKSKHRKRGSVEIVL
ncbi:MAG TPA: DOMON domain-containing protein, partial [Sphaerochaeta sp.]|nr:DOMON domain-containing protein [Sphaerochaeta sp.]